MFKHDIQDNIATPPNPRDPRKQLMLMSIFLLSTVAILSMGTQFFFHRFVDEQYRTGELIGVISEQNILILRATLNTIEHLSIRSAESRELAKKDLARLRDNEAFLLAGHYENINSGHTSSLSTELQNIIFKPPQDAIRKMAIFQSLISQSLSVKPEYASKQFVDVLSSEIMTLVKNELVESIDAISQQLKLENKQKIEYLEISCRIILFLICIVIVWMSVFILPPMSARIEAYSNHIKRNADFDPLSGLLNRRSFSLLASSALAATRRYNKDLSLVSFDIDYFKKINDVYGHAAGDLAIRHVSSLIKENVRSSDLVSRFGGEEFIVLLIETGAMDALATGEKIRRAIAASDLFYQGTKISLTVSAGVSSLETHENSLDGLLRRADTALYQAKSSGRNNILPYKHPTQTFIPRRVWAKAQTQDLQPA